MLEDPPCQGFSSANTRGRQKKLADPTYEDPRNNLVIVFAEIIRKFQPNNLIFENVQGLLHYDKGKIFKLLLYKLIKAGYHYEWRLTNAVHYGVPQNRIRVMLVGWRIGQPDYEWPIITNYCEAWEDRRGCLECGFVMLNELIKKYIQSCTPKCKPKKQINLQRWMQQDNYEFNADDVSVVWVEKATLNALTGTNQDFTLVEF